MTRHAIDVQRVAIGVVFVWFGVLKVAGHSPVAGLVTQTIGVAQLGHASVVGTLGVVEAGIGFGLLFGVALRTTLLLFILQQIGTFLVLIVRPELAFQHHNPLLLTMTGEFVVKNLVLMASGLTIAADCTCARLAAASESEADQRSRMPRGVASLCRFVQNRASNLTREVPV